MNRLSSATISSLPDFVERPSYPRDRVKAGVVHLGVGAFHRAHQAMVFDSLLAAGDLRWGITGISLRSGGIRDRLVPQDCLYTAVIRGGEGERYRVIGSMRDALVAPSATPAVLNVLAASHSHVVTLTITEKGYKVDRASGALAIDDPQIQADLHNLDAPETAAGFLVAGLRRRYRNGMSGLTIMSCDNLPRNGELLKSAVLQLAEAHDADLGRWIGNECSFPHTMVDRIVPATTEEDIAALGRRIGIQDRGAVKTEAFWQWIVEKDSFSGAAPDLEAAGVQFTGNVSAWEDAKLRLLNGAHSAIAYLGGLMGVEYVHQFVSTADGEEFVKLLWAESRSTLAPPADLDLDAYCAALMGRFGNAALRHETHQIAMDGSQKLPQRLCSPAATRLAQGQSIEALALAIAAWMRWQNGIDDQGRRFRIVDPLTDKIRMLLRGVSHPGDQALAMLTLREVFSEGLAEDATFRASLTAHVKCLAAHGARAAMHRLASQDHLSSRHA